MAGSSWTRHTMSPALFSAGRIGSNNQKKDGKHEMKKEVLSEQERLERKRISQRAYVRRNREKVRAYQKEYYKKIGKEGIHQRYLDRIDYHKDYYKRNKKRINRLTAQWHRAHPIESQAHHAKWIEANREHWNAYMREYHRRRKHTK